MNENELKDIFAHYNFNMNNYVGKKAISTGHINTTYTLYFDQGNRVKRYLLQRINTNVFKNPVELMDNIEKVTTFGKNILKSEDVKNYKNHIIRIVPSSDNKTFIQTKSGNYYRVYHYIEGGVSFNTSNDPVLFENAGRCIGYFQNILATYPIDSLHETIKDFHNTPKRYDTFLRKIDECDDKIISECLEEINFYKEHKDIAFSIQPLLDEKKMPARVTHNDTKLNNIMFDYDSHDDLCLVDLDTIMPGCICYDFGDFVRSGCNMGDEDATDLSTVIFNKDLFISFAKGYIDATSPSITQIELNNLTQGAILMTYECGLRFLSDYLDGNKYFKVDYPKHNLVRTRTQICMVKQLLENKEELDKIIKDIYLKAKS